MNYKNIIFVFLVFASKSCFCQYNKVDISINGLYSSINKIEIGNDSYYHYNLKPKLGLSFDLYYTHPAKFINYFSAVINLGARNTAYEGRHYAGLVENSPEPEKMYRKYFWSNYRLNILNLNIGTVFVKKGFRVLTLFESNLLLHSTEKKQEVHLTDFFNSDLFFEEKRFNAKKYYNPVSIGFRFELDYFLFNNFYLNINYSLGISSIIKTSSFNLNYQTRTLGIGIKYVDLFPN